MPTKQRYSKKAPLMGLPSQGNSIDGSFLLQCYFVGISGLLEFVLQRLGDGSFFPPPGISDNGRNQFLINSERGEN